MSFVGPDLPTQEISTGFTEELVQVEAKREGEIREAQRISRVMKDLVDVDKLPLINSREVLLQAGSFSGRVAINHEAKMRDGINRYNNYVNNFNNGMRDYLSIFEVPTSSQPIL
jgi:hypothetical protein